MKFSIKKEENMAHVKRSIIIDSPVAKVFDFVTNPDNWTRYVTSLIDVRNVSNDVPVSGTTFKWVYRMLGMNFSGKGRVMDYDKNRKFIMRMEGAFPITETYLFSKEDNGTKLAVEIDYEVPGKVLGVVANRLAVEKMNQKEAAAVLEKVKALCEAL